MTKYLDTWSLERRAGRLSLVDRLRLALMQPEQTLISGLDASKLALMVDISHWQGDVDIARMVREGGIAACLPKMSDGLQVREGGPYELTNYIDDKFYQNLQRCYDAGIPCLPYHYVQVAIPDYTVQDLINWQWKVMDAALSKLKAKVSYHAIVLDVEERNGSDTNTRDVVLGLMAKLREHPEYGKVPVIVYTSMSVLNLYPALRDQLSYQGANQNLWLAQWVYNTITTTTWERLKSEYIPKIEMKVLTPGFANWWAVQWSSSFILPGCAGRCDLSFYRSTKEGLWDWLGYGAAQPEEPEDPEEPEEPEDPEDPEPADPEIEATLARIEETLAETLDKVNEIRGKFS